MENTLCTEKTASSGDAEGAAETEASGETEALGETEYSGDAKTASDARNNEEAPTLGNTVHASSGGNAISLNHDGSKTLSQKDKVSKDSIATKESSQRETKFDWRAVGDTFECPLCKLEYTTEPSFVDHLRVSHDTSILPYLYACPFSDCLAYNNEYTSLDVVTHHVFAEHQPDGFDTSSIQFRVNPLFEASAKAKDPQRLNSTNSEGQVAVDAEEQLNWQKHSREQLECPVCCKEITSDGNLMKHLLRIHNTTATAYMYKCPEEACQSRKHFVTYAGALHHLEKKHKGTVTSDCLLYCPNPAMDLAAMKKEFDLKVIGRKMKKKTAHLLAQTRIVKRKTYKKLQVVIGKPTRSLRTEIKPTKRGTMLACRRLNVFPPISRRKPAELGSPDRGSTSGPASTYTSALSQSDGSILVHDDDSSELPPVHHVKRSRLRHVIKPTFRGTMSSSRRLSSAFSPGKSKQENRRENLDASSKMSTTNVGTRTRKLVENQSVTPLKHKTKAAIGGKFVRSRRGSKESPGSKKAKSKLQVSLKFSPVKSRRSLQLSSDASPQKSSRLRRRSTIRTAADESGESGQAVKKKSQDLHVEAASSDDTTTGRSASQSHEKKQRKLKENQEKLNLKKTLKNQN